MYFSTLRHGLPAQIVEILLVESQQNVSEVVDERSARIAADAFNYLKTNRICNQQQSFTSEDTVSDQRNL